MAMRMHLLPENCYICGGPEHKDGSHNFLSNKDAAAGPAPCAARHDAENSIAKTATLEAEAGLPLGSFVGAW